MTAQYQAAVFLTKTTELKYNYNTGKGEIDVTLSIKPEINIISDPWASNIRRLSSVKSEKARIRFCRLI